MQQQLSKQQSKYPILEYETEAMHINIVYTHKIKYKSKVINAKIFIVPKVKLYNAPLEIQLKGFCSLLNSQKSGNIGSTIDGLQITESYVFQKEEQLQKNDRIIQQRLQTSEKSYKSQKDTNKGQQFLQGCQVFYQLDQITKKRLQILQQNVEYIYPIQFDLPENIPQTIDQFILKGIYLTVKYQLNLNIRSIQVQNNKKNQQKYILPFDILPEEKTYPYEQLLIKQKIRCYHQYAKISQKQENNCCLRCLRYICPKNLFKSMKIMDNKIYNSKYNNYDLFHLELVVIVSRNSNIFLVARAYKQPQQNMMSIIRDKKNSDNSTYKEMNSMAQMPYDVSLGSVKQTQRKNIYLTIKKVEVQMYAQLQGFPQQLIFKKMIVLNNVTYDMIQGQIMINLDDYLPFSRSYKSELFTLDYNFKIRGYFADDQEQNFIQYEDYIVQQHKKELIL